MRLHLTTKMRGWHGIAGPLLMLPFCSALTSCVLCSEDFPEACLQQFNKCESDPGEILGSTLVELDLRKSNVRTREAVVGNLVADAYVHTAQLICGGQEPCPHIALQNGGGLRSQTACGERELIPIGPLYERDINQILPFDNELVVVNLSGRDLKLGLEHAVDQLGLQGKSGQAGHFLQVSGLKFKVDCSQAPHALDSGDERIATAGARIVEGSLFVRSSTGVTDPVWEPVDVSAMTTYPVVMNTYMASGGDNFIAFVSRDGDGQAICASGQPPCIGNFVLNESFDLHNNGEVLTDSAAVSQYIKEQRTIAPFVENRIEIRQNCVAGLN